MRSMTGFGRAAASGEGFEVTVEMKAVNHRFYKSNWRLPSVFQEFESTWDNLVRQSVRRGSASISVHFRRTDEKSMAPVRTEVVAAYQKVFRELSLDETVIPTMPGVLGATDEEATEPEVLATQQAITKAVEALVGMREAEGAGLVAALGTILDELGAARGSIQERAPTVVEEYHEKLKQRAEKLLAGSGVELDDTTLAREVAVFADRCDVTEELDRLGIHIDAARKLLSQDGEIGRKLDFLAQEMLREVNTIGSKASDAQLGKAVIESKAQVERFKEQVQNVE